MVELRSGFSTPEPPSVTILPPLCGLAGSLLAPVPIFLQFRGRASSGTESTMGSGSSKPEAEAGSKHIFSR